MTTTQFIRAEVAENAVRAIRLAAGKPPGLDDGDRRRCEHLARRCITGTITRAEITRQLDEIAAGR